MRRAAVTTAVPTVGGIPQPRSPARDQDFGVRDAVERAATRLQWLNWLRDCDYYRAGPDGDELIVMCGLSWIALRIVQDHLLAVRIAARECGLKAIVLTVRDHTVRDHTVRDHPNGVVHRVSVRD